MDLQNCSLPIRHLTDISNVLQANDLPFRVPDSTYSGYGYNCWGYVAFNFGWEPVTKWLQGDEMERHLSNHTKPISKDEAVAGDVIVFRRGDYLMHTALVTHELEIICHKPGANELCVDTMTHAKEMYGGSVSFARPNKS